MISIQIRILLILFSIFTAGGIFLKIRKSSCKTSDAVFWIALSVLLVVMGFFPQFPIMCAQALGVESPVNFVYLVIIFILLVKCFSLSIKLSMTTYKVEQLAKYIAIKDAQIFSDKENNGK